MNTTRLVSFVLFGFAAGFGPAQSPFPASTTATAVTATTKPMIQPAAVRPKPAQYRIPTGWERHVITVKFRDGLIVRLRDGALTDLGTGGLAKAGPALALARGGTWARTHTLAEGELDRLRAIGEQNVGFALHDLNLQFRCALPASVDAEVVIDALNALDCVELAESLPCPMAPPQAPDVRHKQGYSEPAPRGTGAGSFQGLPDNNLANNFAACGGLSRIANIEFGFDPAHVDLPPVAVLTPQGSTQPAWDAHGTAVLGMLASRNDGFGTTGIAPHAQLFFAHTTTPAGIYNVPASLSLAANAVGAGGIVLIEVHIAGPRWNGLPNSQVGFLPVEWHYQTWQTLRNFGATGVTFVEAAGNGAQDLDDPYYGGWFSVQNDTGALMVGAGAAPGGSDTARSRLWFSNFGSTVDLQGWGEKVTTTGYGDLYAGLGPQEYYTQVFNGTSSASPVVAGACAVLQSLQWERRNFYLTPFDLRAALRRSGSPQQNGIYPASQNIGPLPDLMRTAIELHLYGGLGMAHGFGQSNPGNGGNGLQFGSSGFESVLAMAEFDDDGPGPNPPRLYVAGQFTKIGNVPASNIACWNGVGWQALATGIGASGVNGYNGTVRSLVVHDADGAGPQLPQLYAGGMFTRAGTVTSPGVARWNGTTWSSVGGGCTGNVFSLATIDEDGAGPELASLVVGGEITAAGALFVYRIARWRADLWHPMGTWSAMDSGFDNRVTALEVYDADDSGPGLPRLVAGGMFQLSGNTQMRSLAIWNGGAWQELGGGTGFWGDTINALEAVPIANTQQQVLVVGGTFWSFGGMSTNTQGLAVWTGSGWFMPSSPAWQPYTLASFDDGTDATLPRQRDVYLSSPNGLFRLDPMTWTTTPLPVPVQLPANSVADCMMAFDEDGPGVEPPSLLFGANLFGGPAQSAGIAKMFGTTPVSLTGWQTMMPTGCGGPYQPTIAATGMPVLGAPFTVQFDCLPGSLPALCVGVPELVPIPMCGGQSSCALGVQPLVITYGSKSATYQFPNRPAFVGIYFAFQGIELLALPFGSRCSPPYLPIDVRTSDTLVLHF